MQEFHKNMNLIERLVRYIFPTNVIDIMRVQDGISTYVYRIFWQNETFYLRVLPEEKVVSLPSNYIFSIRLSSICTNVRILARSLQKRPANYFTQHQLEVLREDIQALCQVNL